MIVGTIDLNNREIAIVVWLLILIFFVCFRSSRFLGSVWSLGKIIFQPKLLTFLVLMFIPSALGFYLLQRNIFGDLYTLKGFLVWLIFAGIKGVLSINDKSSLSDFYKYDLKPMVGVGVVAEFVFFMYPFHLLVELIFVPVVSLLVLVLSYQELTKDNANEDVKALFRSILRTLTTFVGIFVVVQIFKEPGLFFRMENIYLVLLPSSLTALSLPIWYLGALCIAYERLYTQIKIFSAKEINHLKILSFCFLRARLRLKQVKHLAGTLVSKITVTCPEKDVVDAIKVLTREPKPDHPQDFKDTV